jgi:hypothetical protein
MPRSAKTKAAPSHPGRDVPAAAVEWATMQRALFLDVPLMLATEMSIFLNRMVEEQARHWCALAACSSYAAVIDENRRHVEASTAEIAEELDVIARGSSAALSAA